MCYSKVWSTLQGFTTHFNLGKVFVPFGQLNPVVKNILAYHISVLALVSSDSETHFCDDNGADNDNWGLRVSSFPARILRMSFFVLNIPVKDQVCVSSKLT